MIIVVHSEEEMKSIGARIGALLHGGEIIELRGDVGAGKTTLAKGIAEGLGVKETVQSPSFTINRVYEAHDSLYLSHYDFYRLQDAGIMADELAETIHDRQTVTLIEWSDVVEDVLPSSRTIIRISALGENERELTIDSQSLAGANLLEQLQ